jgi:hypothetical protein
LQVNVKDVNDNAPHFTKKIYTGGVTTDADYGTVVMQVKVRRHFFMMSRMLIINQSDFLGIKREIQTNVPLILLQQ